MEKINNEDFLSILELALFDKNINNYEFRILAYIFKHDDFLVSDIKKLFGISSFNMISKFIKNLVKQNYIIKQSKHIKNSKNQSSYKYFINANKLQLLKDNNIPSNSPYFVHWSLYYYFFDKIPTTRKIDKSANLHQISLLLDFDNLEVTYIKKLIDFVASNELLKNLYSRPLSFRKNIKQIIALYYEQKQNL